MDLQPDNEQITKGTIIYDGKAYVLHVCANMDRFKKGFEDVLKKYDFYVIKHISQLRNKNYHSLYYIIEQDAYIVVKPETMEQKIKRLCEKYNKND